MIYGAILAGGIGKRMERYSIPKQFINLGGVPIIVRSLRVFLANEKLDMIYVAVHANWIEYAKKLFNGAFSKEQLLRIRVVSGGKERLDSLTNIISDIVGGVGMKEDDLLICHDSVRPFVRQQMIDDCIEATREYGFALTVVPINDTIHVTGQDKDFIDRTLDRDSLYNGQTPSGFNLLLLNNILNQCSEEEKAKITGTTQLVLKAGHRIKVVKGHTSNFKITTDNDFDLAERIVQSTLTKKKTELLDCTLRDGGIAINFEFGEENMARIKKSLEDSGVEYIECGYINERSGFAHGHTCFDNEQSVRNFLMENGGKKPGITYLAMIDYGTFDLNKLAEADDQGIDGIRFAFHKENMAEALRDAKIILKKGYQLFIQPMVSIRYDDDEFREMILVVNRCLPETKAFYIVDSFGQMDSYDLIKKLELADLYLSEKMKLGFHAHNNRQMAFSNALTWLHYAGKHEFMLDSSIMGIGKGAGNLCTELIMPELNAEGGCYDTVGIYKEINGYIADLQKEHPWGYSLDYYLSSLYGCTPSYIKIFTKDERVTVDVLVALLKNMPSEKKAACDRAFAQNYLADYFNKEK